MIPKLKVCCIASPEEADLAIDCGAEYLGLVSAMPSGPGVLHESRIAEIIAHVGARAHTILLTSLRNPSEVARQWERCPASGVQLTDNLTQVREDLLVLRSLLPKVTLWQVLHITSPQSVEEALRIQDLVDGLLLDSGNPNAPTKTLGGTGKTHDWSISAELIRRVAPLPVWLAGGLNPGNVASAITQTRPHGIDICSGVRTEGRLDGSKLSRLCQQIRSCPAGEGW